MFNFDLNFICKRTTNKGFWQEDFLNVFFKLKEERSFELVIGFDTSPD